MAQLDTSYCHPDIDQAWDYISDKNVSPSQAVKLNVYGLSQSEAGYADANIEGSKPITSIISPYVVKRFADSVDVYRSLYLQILLYNKYNNTETFKEKSKEIFNDFLDNFKVSLSNAFDVKPVEDGYTHPAEEIIRNALTREQESVIEWFRQIFNEGNSVCLVSSVLICLGRLDFSIVGSWGIELARIALANHNVEVRDAAVLALEMWGTKEAVDLLSNHNDDTKWLQEYIQRVIQEFSDI